MNFCEADFIQFVNSLLVNALKVLLQFTDIYTEQS